MALSEAETRARLIAPGHPRLWGTEDLIRCEETTGDIEVVARRRPRGNADYIPRVKVIRTVLGKMVRCELAGGP